MTAPDGGVVLAQGDVVDDGLFVDDDRVAVVDVAVVDVTGTEVEELPGHPPGELQLLAFVPPTISTFVKVKSLQLPSPHRIK